MGSPALRLVNQGLLEEAFQAMEPAVLLDDKNQVVVANSASQKLLGDRVGSLAQWVPSVKAPKPFDESMLQCPGLLEDVTVQGAEAPLLVDLRVSPLDQGTLLHLRDVEEKRHQEQQLLAKHSDLKQAYVQMEKHNAELRSMQQSLVQAGKMAALGELAAGIAHELNQPLQGIRGYAQELEELAVPLMQKSEDESLLKGGLHEIISNVDKMAKIIHYLRTFTRKSVEDLEMVDVHHAIEESLKMLDRQFASRGIEVERHFGKLEPIYANPVQLEQVFINLSSNARDAIESTGRGSGKVTITTRADGDFVEILFEDDGVGMGEQAQSKVFNPFFTTKEVGQGMGLGMSLSYGILNKLHGSIVVESQEGKGARFKIRLPRDFRELG